MTMHVHATLCYQVFLLFHIRRHWYVLFVFWIGTVHGNGKRMVTESNFIDTIIRSIETRLGHI